MQLRVAAREQRTGREGTVESTLLTGGCILHCRPKTKAHKAALGGNPGGVAAAVLVVSKAAQHPGNQTQPVHPVQMHPATTTTKQNLRCPVQRPAKETGLLRTTARLQVRWRFRQLNHQQTSKIQLVNWCLVQQPVEC
jgi:hypothetical protein